MNRFLLLLPELRKLGRQHRAQLAVGEILNATEQRDQPDGYAICSHLS